MCDERPDGRECVRRVLRRGRGLQELLQDMQVRADEVEFPLYTARGRGRAPERAVADEAVQSVGGGGGDCPNTRSQRPGATSVDGGAD